MKDLVVLVADKPMQVVLKALVARIARVAADVMVHSERDPGVRLRAEELLRAQLRNYRYAVAVCDVSGSGREKWSREEIEARLEDRLQSNGWEGRAAAIVIDPELENWMFGDWKATSAAVEWTKAQSMREWLIETSHLAVERSKPADPKAALEGAVEYCGKRWSSAIHQQIAATARFEACTDAAFLKLKATLQRWFPVTI